MLVVLVVAVVEFILAGEESLLFVLFLARSLLHFCLRWSFSSRFVSDSNTISHCLSSDNTNLRSSVITTHHKPLPQLQRSSRWGSS